jgi:hypothetical protein
MVPPALQAAEARSLGRRGTPAPVRALDSAVLSVEVRLVLPADGRIVGPVALAAMPQVGDALSYQGARFRVALVMWSFHGPIVQLAVA